MASKTFRAMIFDDEPDKANEWCAQLNELNIKGLDVVAPQKEEIQSILDSVYGRRRTIDEGRTSNETACKLDDVDVLIVDFDLRHFDDHRGFATGEEIAYSARLYTKVKTVVVVNHPNIGLDNFDLTLQKDRDFRGDVYIGHKQVANPGLWRADPEHDGFLPWSWPVLIEDVSTFEQCCNEVRGNFEKPVLEFFGLNSEETRPSAEMLEYLGIRRDSDVPISQLSNSMSFFRPKDRESLKNDVDRHTHIMTALLRRWFRRWVLPPQTLIADLTHVASALPWGVASYEKAESWNEIASCGRSLGKCDSSKLFLPEMVGAEFSHQIWVGRPTYAVRKARALLEATENVLASFQLEKLPNVAFAEDLSRFVSVESALSYSMTLDGEYQERNVCSPDNIHFEGNHFHPRDVVYVPQSLML